MYAYLFTSIIMAIVLVHALDSLSYDDAIETKDLNYGFLLTGALAFFPSIFIVFAYRSLQKIIH